MKTPKLFTRRELVQGLASIPLLGTMLQSARAAAAGVSPVRFCFLTFGNGIHGDWAPAETGTTFKLTPYISTLEPIRSRITILKNLTLIADRNQGHYYPTRALLTGWNVKNQPGNAGADEYAHSTTASMDQVIAERIAATARTPVHSLQVANFLGSGSKWVLTYSTGTPAVPLPPERDPLAAFNRLVAKFVPQTGDPVADRARMQAQMVEGKSVLDGVRADVASLSARAGSARPQMQAYLAALQMVEEGFRTDGQSGSSCKNTPAAPAGGVWTSATVRQHQAIQRRHADVVAFAFSCGLTRVATLQMSEFTCHYPFQFIDQTYEAHNLSHYVSLSSTSMPTSERIRLITEHSRYWLGEFTYFVQKLGSIPEGTGTVLDNSLALVAPANGNSDLHTGRNTPFILAGGAGGQLRNGRVIDCGRRNHNDLLVSVAHMMGFPDVKSFGDPSLNKGPLPL